MPSLLSQFLPRVSSRAKMDLIPFSEAFALGVRSAANCGGSTTRAASGVCGIAVGLMGGSTLGISGFVGVVATGAFGCASRAIGTCSCLASIFSSAAGAFAESVVADLKTAGPVGHLSLPPA